MLTIAIPTFNEEYHIRQLLESLRAQKIDKPLEVIVADANSTDSTREVIEDFQSVFPHLHIVPGGTPAEGRNSAGKYARGEYIFFIDADVTLPDPLFLQTAVEYMKKHSLGIAATTLSPRSTRYTDKYLVGASNLIMRATKSFNPSGSMCIAVRSDVFLKSGGYPENVHMSEDHDFVRACAQHGQYGILPLPVEFSVRRLEKEGRLGLAYKYAKVTVYRTFVGPITKPVVEYEFTYSDKENRA